ncbi:MAG: DNA-binding response regulator [Gammaproteobacteria bacterium RIFCSPHIGHO2_12_FULL_37_14]|nr:MAG: DNA-binding response regulator [Gammaproteobacteria bacterium RIFCSPHIGHO2_12_FULL_37_14]
MKKITLLVIEDEEAIRDMLRFSLPATDFVLLDAESTSKAMNILAYRIPDLIILDWMLPDKSGIDFIKVIRKQDILKDMPIIMLTAKAEEDNKIKGLTVGADDYLTKPFSPNELVARIKTVLRRGLIKSTSGEIKIGNIILNVNKCQVFIDEQLLKLTPTEYKIIHFFMLHPNKKYSRDQLITHIWGRNAYIDERTIDVQMKRLRQKLKPFGYHHHIKTIRNVGYFFSGESDEKAQ